MTPAESQAATMRLMDPACDRVMEEVELMAERLPLHGARVLELGCGRARMTRLLAGRFAPASITATEVDRRQHEKNLLIDDLPNVRFLYGGAEAIDAPDGSFDVVILLKSLHHVPSDLMERSLDEIARVLRPGGLAYISEPVYAGAFNAILRRFHDEQAMRAAAFAAVQAAVARGPLELVEQIFFLSPSHYDAFADFEERILRVTHTDHRLDDALYAEVRSAFEAHLTADGANFQNPMRVDLLRRPSPRV